MNVHEVIEAWKEARDQDKWPFAERFFHLTGLREEEVTDAFNQWNMTRRDRVETIAEKHGVTIEEGGFQAFLVERFWPEDEESRFLLKAVDYLNNYGDKAGADCLNLVLDCKVRLGRAPLQWSVDHGPRRGVGDPREGRGWWPPEEDCPYCPTGRKEDPDSGHKMSCSWMKGHSGRLTTPVKKDGGTFGLIWGEPVIISEKRGE